MHGGNIVIIDQFFSVRYETKSANTYFINKFWIYGTISRHSRHNLQRSFAVPTTSCSTTYYQLKFDLYPILSLSAFKILMLFVFLKIVCGKTVLLFQTKKYRLRPWNQNSTFNVIRFLRWKCFLIRNQLIGVLQVKLLLAREESYSNIKNIQSTI